MASPTEGKSRFEEAMDTYIDDLCEISLEDKMKAAQLQLENIIQKSIPQMYNSEEFFMVDHLKKEEENDEVE